MNKIVKRDGAIVDFDASKIENAILKAAKVTKEFDETEAAKITKKVILMAEEIANKKESNLKAPTVEEVQDAVEISLFSFGYPATAKAYYEKMLALNPENQALRDYISKMKID